MFVLVIASNIFFSAEQAHLTGPLIAYPKSILLYGQTTHDRAGAPVKCSAWLDIVNSSHFSFSIFTIILPLLSLQ